MAKKCKKTVGVFLGASLDKVRFNATTLDNESGGSKPMAWNIQSLDELIYGDIFSGRNINDRNKAISKANKAMKHSKLIAKVKRYLPASTRTSSVETLNKTLIGLDFDAQKKNETDAEYTDRLRSNGTTIRARGIAINQIIKSIEAEYNIQNDKNLAEDENEKLTNKLKYQGSRVLSTMSLYAPIGRQISIATGYKAKSDSVLTDKEYYISIGKAAVESLASTGSVKILNNVDIINNDYTQLDGDPVSTQDTIKGEGVVLNLDIFTDGSSINEKTGKPNKDFKRTDAFIEKRDTLGAMLEKGFTNNKLIQDYTSFDTTFAASQIVNTYTTPVNLVAPMSMNHYEKIRNKNKTEGKDNPSLFSTIGLGNGDGHQDYGVPEPVAKMFSDEGIGLSKRRSQINTAVDDIFLELNKKLQNAFDSDSSTDEIVTLRKVFGELGLDSQKQAAIFGVFYDAVPDTIESKIGQAISKENPLINLIMNYKTYAGGQNYVQEHVMYRTTRFMQKSTFLNEQAGKWFDRPMVNGGIYSVKRDSKAFITIIESLVDEFMNDSRIDGQTDAEYKQAKIDRRSMIENEGENKGLDTLVREYKKLFVDKPGGPSVKDQIDFLAVLSGDKVADTSDGKRNVYDIDFKFSSPWDGLAMVQAVYDIRTGGENPRLRYRTKPDATASGIILTLMQALGVNRESDKVIIKILTKLQVAREKGIELSKDELYADAYDIVQKAVDVEDFKLKNSTSVEKSTKDLMKEFMTIGIFGIMRDIIKPITMLTNYEAGEETAIRGAAEEFADTTIDYLINKAHKQDTDGRNKALEKINEMILEADESFYSNNNIEKFHTGKDGKRNPEIQLANIVGIKEVFVKYFSMKDGIAYKLRKLQDAEFYNATTKYKEKTKEMYNMISDLHRADQSIYGTGSNNIIRSIIPAVTWHYISKPEVNDKGFVTNKDHLDYKFKDGKLIGKLGDIDRNTDEGKKAFRTWYQKTIKKYGMPITSKKQVIFDTEKIKNNLDPMTMLVLKEEKNWLTAIVNPIHSLDAAILLVSHDATVKEMKKIIADNKDTQLAKDVFNELQMASGMIHDANNASAMYNEIFQKHYRQNSILLNQEYDIQEQLSMLYDSYQAVDSVINIEDGAVIYQFDKNDANQKYVSNKVKTKSKIINDTIVQHEDMFTNPKLFGFNTENIETGDNKSYLKPENKTNGIDVEIEYKGQSEQSEPVVTKDSINPNVEANESSNDKLETSWINTIPNLPQSIIDGDRYYPTGHPNNPFGKDKASKVGVSEFFESHSKEMIKDIESGDPFIVLDAEWTFNNKDTDEIYDPGRGGAKEEILQVSAKEIKYEDGKIVPTGKKESINFIPTNSGIEMEKGDKGFENTYNGQVNGLEYNDAEFFAEQDGAEKYSNTKAQKQLYAMLKGFVAKDGSTVPIIAYNGIGADFKVMSQFENIDKILANKFKLYDSHVLANWALRNNDSIIRDNSAGKKMYGRKQSEVAEILGVKYDGKAHDAEADVDVMSGILEKIMNNGLDIKDKLEPVETKVKNQKANDATGSNKIDKKLEAKIREILQMLYPNINLEYTINAIDGTVDIQGQANIEAQTVLINSLLQSQDTLPHEYAHHYIAMFRDAPIVKKAIEKWGSEEALVQAIGEQTVKQKGEAYGWWKKFSNWVKDLFNELDSKSKEELKDLLTDSFLTNQDLGNKNITGSGVFSQKKQKQRKNGEPKEAPKKRAKETMKQKMKYELDRKNHQVDLTSPVDEILYNLNTTIANFAGDVGASYLEPVVDAAGKMAHDWMYENSDIYKMQYDRTVKYWDSATWLQSMKGYMNTWGRFKDWHTLNQMITESDQAAQRRKHIEDTKISEINRQMIGMSKQEQNDIFEVMSLAPVFWLMGEDEVLRELMKLKGKDVTIAIDKWIETYSEQISDKYKVQRIKGLAEVITYTRQPDVTKDIYNIEQLSPKTIDEKQAMGALLALEAIKHNIKTNDDGTISKSYENVFALLAKNPKLLLNLTNISVATKQSFDEVYNMTGDEKLYRDNLLFEQFEKPKEFQIATKAELNSNRYPSEHGWKILRSPSGKEYGVVYRDIVDETIQPGAGTSVRYKTSDILVPRDKYKSDAKNVTRVYNGEKQTQHKITLTKEELTELGMIRNPGDTLVRAYGRMIEIKDTQAARDELINQTMTYYVNDKSGIETFDKSLNNMDVKDRPIFISLPKTAIAKEVLENNDNIGTHYKVVTGITSIGGLNEQIHLVRKDASDMIIGFKDPVLFKDNAFLRKSAYVVRQMVKMTKIHWAIVNVGKIIGDATSNAAILAAYGVPLMEMPGLAKTALEDLKSLEDLRIRLLDAEFDKHTGKGNQKKIDAIKKRIQNHPMAVLLNNGLLQSLSVEILNKDESVISGLQNDIESLFNKFLKDKDGNNNDFSTAIKGLSQMGWNIEDLLKFASKGAKEFKVLESFGKGLETTGDRIHANKENGDMAKYLSEFIASPDSTAVRLGSALVMTIDIASRRMLLDTLLSRGIPEKEAIQTVTDAFIDYKINMPKELKVLSDYGVLLFPSFWMRIQKIIYSTLKANPAGAAIGIGMQNALDLHIETILDSNVLYKMFGKDLSGSGLSFVHSPPLGLDTFIPTDLFGF